MHQIENDILMKLSKKIEVAIYIIQHKLFILFFSTNFLKEKILF